MTIVGVMSDLHGNKVAVEAAWREMEPLVDELLVAGDIVGVLGWPDWTVAWVEEHADYTVLGNHDCYVHEDYPYVPGRDLQKQEHRYVTGCLTEASIDYLHSLPEVIETDEWIAAHAHPFEEPHTGHPATNYVDKKDWTNFGSKHLDGEMVVIGHTHVQGKLDLSKFDGQSGHILNPGSIGVPWYEDARWAIFDDESRDIELHRTGYDNSLLRNKFKQEGLDGWR